MRRSNRRSKRIRNKNIVGIGLIAFVLICILSIFTLYFFLKKTSITIDPNTFCPVNGATSITAILIDETDPLSPIQQASLKKELLKIKNQIPTHGKIEVYLIGNTQEQVLSPILSFCNPGKGTDANKFYQNPKLIKKKWNENFNKPIDKVLSSLSNSKIQDQSPIMESIQSIAITAFKNIGSKNAQYRLIIASDMLQYTPEFNLYNNNPNNKTFLNNNFLKKMHSDLRGVQIDILLLRRTSNKNIQGHLLIKFWETFFEKQGTDLNSVYSITG